MGIQRSVLVLLACLSAAVHAQSLTLEEIDRRGATPLTREEVIRLVNGQQITLISSSGERKWTNRPDGTLTVARIGGPGGFNPHHKSGRGRWVVREDAAYCADFDFGHMLTDGYCWQLFRFGDQLLVHATPETDESVGGTISFAH